MGGAVKRCWRLRHSTNRTGECVDRLFFSVGGEVLRGGLSGQTFVMGSGQDRTRCQFSILVLFDVVDVVRVQEHQRINCEV